MGIDGTGLRRRNPLLSLLGNSAAGGSDRSTTSAVVAAKSYTSKLAPGRGAPGSPVISRQQRPVTTPGHVALATSSTPLGHGGGGGEARLAHTTSGALSAANSGVSDASEVGTVATAGYNHQHTAGKSVAEASEPELPGTASAGPTYRSGNHTSSAAHGGGGPSLSPSPQIGTRQGASLTPPGIATGPILQSILEDLVISAPHSPVGPDKA